MQDNLKQGTKLNHAENGGQFISHLTHDVLALFHARSGPTDVLAKASPLQNLPRPTLSVLCCLVQSAAMSAYHFTPQ